MKTKLARTEGSQPFEKKKLFLPLFLASLMIFSAFAVILSGYGPSEEEVTGAVEYGGYEFTPHQGRGWQATVNGAPLLLRYSPFEVESLYQEVDMTPLHTLFEANKIYVSIAPEDSVRIPLQELYTHLKITLPSVFLACTQDGQDCAELPLKTCADAGEGVGVLILKEGTEEGISLEEEEHCVTLTGREQELTFFVDKLLLSLYGLL